MTIRIGRRRGIARCSNGQGVFVILALDHRNNLRQALNPADPEAVKDRDLVEFKQQVIEALAPGSSSVLLDPEYGASQVIGQDILPGRTGLLVSLEETGYTGDPTARASQILPGWNVGKIKRMGADGVKLLVYYHPDSDVAREQENLVSAVAEDCAGFDIPFFLEPLSYSLNPDRKSLTAAEKRRIVVETASRLTPLGIDILKAEFPLDVKDERDEKVWAEACRELTQASQVPWALLSSGVDFETFLRQVSVACESGASGVIAGRAIWKEAVGLETANRQTFLSTVAIERLQALTAICNQHAVPWTRYYPPELVPEGWYRDYPGL
jgi:tagatose-1,6-bisphosphate aldolase